jgi:Flp pilus assembly protein TadD
MRTKEAIQEFKQGLRLLRDDYPRKALAHMHRASDLDPANPYYMSYLGLAVARAEHKWAEAEEFCKVALRLKRHEAQLYLNLAEVYRTAGRREDAVEIINKGLQNACGDVRLSRALCRLSLRRSPVFSFLSRGHFLNRQFGRLRHRTLQLFAA